MTRPGPAAAVLGSAFSLEEAGEALGPLVGVEVPTRFGDVTLWRHVETGGVLCFRHGRPHRWLPHQIPWRAQALALDALGVRALLLTSSVGVLDPSIPLYVPHLAGDLLMPDNRLPDGSPCTLWPTPHPEQAHLVLQDGLFHTGLSRWTRARFGLPERALTFAYVPGPRTKTAAENRLFAGLGAEVNSMSVGPEAVLAAEAGIPTVAVLTGHKPSAAGGPDRAAVTGSLHESRAATARLVTGFLAEAPAMPPGNLLYRFGDP